MDHMTPAYLHDALVAQRLGLKEQRFKAIRPKLELEGFPKKDRIVGQTLAADVEAWLARRRTINDPVPVPEGAHHTTTGEHRENYKAF